MRGLRWFPAAAALLSSLAGVAAPASAAPMTFQLTVGDVLASVGQTNELLVALGKQARGLKLVPGGTKFAGLTCAGFGDVYQLASVTVLDGTAAFPDLVTTKKGRDAAALATAFGQTGLTPWVPPATNSETDRQFWTATTVAHGLQFASEALVHGDNGLLDATQSAGIFRFSADVPPTAVAGASYRFLLEIVGQTSSSDSALVVFGQQRCVTVVDLVPVDVGVLERLVKETIPDTYVQNGLASRVALLEQALVHRDYVQALDIMAYVVGHLIARTPDHAQPAAARRVVTGVFDVRRGLDFRAATAQCGNGVRETGEACDGADLGGFTCVTEGYQSGTLTCQPSCLFDFSACVSAAVCGDGKVDPGEECDNGAQNSDTQPDACRTNCKLAYCGDGVIDTFEDCEGKNLGMVTSCKQLGYDGGVLKCDTTYCEYDEDGCTFSDN